MHAQIRITMDSAAFEDKNGELELASILRDLAAMVELGVTECPLRDGNGNTVGHFRIVGQPRRFAR